MKTQQNSTKWKAQTTMDNRFKEDIKLLGVLNGKELTVNRDVKGYCRSGNRPK